MKKFKNIFYILFFVGIFATKLDQAGGTKFVYIPQPTQYITHVNNNTK